MSVNLHPAIHPAVNPPCSPLLEVHDLSIGFATGPADRSGRPALATVERLSLQLQPGQTLGLVGESG